MYETTQWERALLVMVVAAKEDWPIDPLREEFKNLVVSTGIEVVDLITVKRKEINPSLYLGKGKVEEIAGIIQEKNINVVIFNNDLSYTQQRNLEDIFLVKTIDRTQLILDIFARHAHSQEGILQVELAQLEYLLPRLKGKGIMLSRLGGGIGTRGPGEKKLEVDRRRISERIHRLTQELEEVKKYRQTIRKKREKGRVFVVSLVGYTNAGKSTLFNVLTQSNEATSSKLFTTLDTVSRSFILHNNLKAILTDTVGFIYKLPPHLIEAFKATLEELIYADVLLHLIDSTAPDVKRQIQAVEEILSQIKLETKPKIYVFNKIDKLNDIDLLGLKEEYPEGVFISALQRVNLESLKDKIYKLVIERMEEVILKVPFNLMELSNYIHNHCEVLKQTYQDDQSVYWVRINPERLAYLERCGVSVEKI